MNYVKRKTKNAIKVIYTSANDSEAVSNQIYLYSTLGFDVLLLIGIAVRVMENQAAAAAAVSTIRSVLEIPNAVAASGNQAFDACKLPDSDPRTIGGSLIAVSAQGSVCRSFLLSLEGINPGQYHIQKQSFVDCGQEIRSVSIALNEERPSITLLILCKNGTLFLADLDRMMIATDQQIQNVTIASNASQELSMVDTLHSTRDSQSGIWIGTGRRSPVIIFLGSRQTIFWKEVPGFDMIESQITSVACFSLKSLAPTLRHNIVHRYSRNDQYQVSRSWSSVLMMGFDDGTVWISLILGARENDEDGFVSPARLLGWFPRTEPVQSNDPVVALLPLNASEIMCVFWVSRQGKVLLLHDDLALEILSCLEPVQDDSISLSKVLVVPNKRSRTHLLFSIDRSGSAYCSSVDTLSQNRVNTKQSKWWCAALRSDMLSIKLVAYDHSYATLVSLTKDGTIRCLEIRQGLLEKAVKARVACSRPLSVFDVCRRRSGNRILQKLCSSLQRLEDHERRLESEENHSNPKNRLKIHKWTCHREVKRSMFENFPAERLAGSGAECSSMPLWNESPARKRKILSSLVSRPRSPKNREVKFCGTHTSEYRTPGRLDASETVRLK